MEVDTLFYNGIVLTINPVFEVIEDGWVAVRGETIERAGKCQAGETLPAAKTLVDARGGIILPGLVNTHTHLPMTLFRGLADDLPLFTWLNEHIFPAEATFIDPDSVAHGTALACAELLLSGTTTCCDGYFLEDAVASAVARSGLRAVLGQGVIDFPAPGVPDPARNVEAAETFARAWQKRCPTITPSIFCHSPYTCSAETLVRAKAAADRLGLVFQIHVAETGDEKSKLPGPANLSPVAYLDSLGILNERTLLVHAVWLEAGDIDIIARNKASVSHNPQSNMKLGSGVAPVDRLLAAGVTVGLGTDGCASNNDLDLFCEMDTAAKLHKVMGMNPTLLDARTVLKMATIDGARAIGLGDKIGSLEPGKQADIIVIDTNQPHLTPLYHPASHLVYAARGADVRDVMIGGRMVVRSRQLLTLDVEEVMASVRDLYQPKIHARKQPL
jgi:5-methylthioadenosine/S-adenosylhomocysteine deaminase